MINTRGVPRYVQAREMLTDQIKSGELPSGEKLPSEQELAIRFGVSRMTIRKSLDDLVDAGLIYRRHGIGTFVSKSTFERNHTHVTDFFSTCKMEGRVPKSIVLEKRIVPASEKIARCLNIETGDQLILITTLRSVDDAPITYHEAYLPVRYFPDLVLAEKDDLSLDKQHVWQLVEQKGHTMANIVEKLEARIADDHLAKLLEVDAGSPILYGERVLFSDEGMPLKYAECFNRGDRYSLSVVLVK